MSEQFENAREVHAWLSGQGWKCSERTVYNHIRDLKLKPDQDGLFGLAAVRKYAKAFLRRVDGAAKDSDLVEQERLRLLSGKAKEAQLKAELTEIKLKVERGELVPKDKVDEILISGVSVLKASMGQFFYSSAQEIVHLVGGDPGKAEDLVDFLKERSGHWFNGFSKKQEFEVEFEGYGDAGGAG